MPNKFVFDNLTGGWNMQEPTTIKENELALADNVFYGADNKLTSRRGIQNIYNPIPDDVSLIHHMDTFNGLGTWVAGGDAGTVATDNTNKKQGEGSVTFTVTVVGTSASIENITLPLVDLTSEKETGAFYFWVNLPVVTNLNSITLTLGNDLDLQDYELTKTTQANGDAFIVGWNLMKYDWEDMVIAGVPDGNIEEVRITLNYSVGFAGGAGFKVDQIYWASGTTEAPVYSLYEVKLTTGVIITLASCKNSIFRLHKGDWVLLKSGFTDGTKFSFVNFNNIIYFSNGIDDYHDYDISRETSVGILAIEYPSAPKAKYLMVVGAIAYAFGIKDSLNELKYTGSAPPNLQTYGNNEFIWDDRSREVGTGMVALPNDAIAIFLENSAYYIDTVTSPSTIRPLDYDGGCQSFRSIQRVGNDTFFLAEDAVYSLSQRQATEGTFGSSSLSDKILPIIQTGSDLTTANAFRGKRVMPNHYYLNIDDSNSGFPTTCLVYNIRLQAWTRYTNIAAHQMIEHEDENGDFHIIIGSVFSGQIKEIEKGFDDNGIQIPVKIHTKEMDFNDPTLFKVVNECDISGFASETALIDITDVLDGEENTTDILDGSDFNPTGSSFTLGVDPLGTVPLTGEPQEGDILLNLFNVRKNVYQSAYRFQIKIESDVLFSAFVLSKIQMHIEPLPIDFFPNDSYI